MATGKTQKQSDGSALDFEAQLWAATDKMRGHMDASEYKHVCLGLSFRQDLHPDLKADLVPVRKDLANPPFNMSDWSRSGGMRQDVRWKFGMPPVNNANYAWIQHFIHHLSPMGVAGFVMANDSMSTQTSNEGEIRKALIEADHVDCMVTLLSGELRVPTAETLVEVKVKTATTTSELTNQAQL